MKYKLLHSSMFFVTIASFSFFAIGSENMTTYLFAHGLADTHKQAHHYTKTVREGDTTYHNDRYIMDGHVVTFDFPDATEGKLRVNRKETSLAQDNEIECLTKEFAKTVYEMNRNQNDGGIILVGISRGASTIINFMASHNNPPEVLALILEAPFDSAQSITENIVQYLHINWIPGIKRLGNRLMSFIFSKYRRDGIQPINVVNKIKATMPILIICSTQDNLVPVHSSIRLYKILKESGHENAHLLVVNSGKHAKIFRDIEGITYQNVTHAFYKKYNLPHNEVYAQQGKVYFEQQCQPSIENITNKYLNKK